MCLTGKNSELCCRLTNCWCASLIFLALSEFKCSGHSINILAIFLYFGFLKDKSRRMQKMFHGQSHFGFSAAVSDGINKTNKQETFLYQYFNAWFSFCSVTFILCQKKIYCNSEMLKIFSEDGIKQKKP